MSRKTIALPIYEDIDYFAEYPPLNFSTLKNYADTKPPFLDLSFLEEYSSILFPEEGSMLNANLPASCAFSQSGNPQQIVAMPPICQQFDTAPGPLFWEPDTCSNEKITPSPFDPFSFFLPRLAFQNLLSSISHKNNFEEIMISTVQFSKRDRVEIVNDPDCITQLRQLPPHEAICVAGALMYQWFSWIGMSSILSYADGYFSLEKALPFNARINCANFVENAAWLTGALSLARLKEIEVSFLPLSRIEGNHFWYYKLGWMPTQCTEVNSEKGITAPPGFLYFIGHFDKTYYRPIVEHVALSVGSFSGVPYCLSLWNQPDDNDTVQLVPLKTFLNSEQACAWFVAPPWEKRPNGDFSKKWRAFQKLETQPYSLPPPRMYSSQRKDYNKIQAFEKQTLPQESLSPETREEIQIEINWYKGALLCEALKNNMPNLATNILETCPYINYIDEEGNSPLMLSVKLKYFSIAQALLDHANLNVNHGAKVIFEASLNNKRAFSLWEKWIAHPIFDINGLSYSQTPAPVFHLDDSKISSNSNPRKKQRLNA